MDEFAKEYHEKLKKLASDFKNSRAELARSRIKLFTAAVARQLLRENKTFDLIVGSGNSGLFITKITQLAYKHLNIKIPPVLTPPVYRFKDDNKTIDDNISLLLMVKECLEDIRYIQNILFVDDEIMQAITAKICFELICKARQDIKNVNATIIAENHFFEWHYIIPKVSISFFAYAPLIQGLNGNIGHFIPNDFHHQISALEKDVVSQNHSMAIIIGGALKRKDKKGTPYFDYEIEPRLEKQISGYKKRKTTLLGELDKLVLEAIEEYKSGKIEFRF